MTEDWDYDWVMSKVIGSRKYSKENTMSRIQFPVPIEYHYSIPKI